MVPFRKRTAILETSELVGSSPAPTRAGDENTQLLAVPKKASARPPAPTTPSPVMSLPKPAPVPRFPATLESPRRAPRSEEMTNLRGSVLRRPDDEMTMLRPMSAPPASPAVRTRSTPPPAPEVRAGLATRSAAVTAAASRPIPTPMDSVRAVVASSSDDASKHGTPRPTARRRSWGALAAMVGAFALLAVAIVAHGDAEGVIVAAKALGSRGTPAQGPQSLAADGDEAEFRVVPLEGAAIPEPAVPHRKWHGGHGVVVDRTPDPPPDPPVVVAVKPAADPPPDDLTLAGTPKTDPCDELCLWKIACKELQASGRDCGTAPGSKE